MFCSYFHPSQPSTGELDPTPAPTQALPSRICLLSVHHHQVFSLYRITGVVHQLLSITLL